jgi:hypothetical protein
MKMGLPISPTDFRTSALMNHAHNWLPSTELPVEKIERNEEE